MSTEEVERLQRELAEAQAKLEVYRAATESASLPVFSWEVGANDPWWSESYLKLLGLPLETRPSAALWETFLDPENLPLARSGFLEALQDPARTSFEADFRVQTVKGWRDMISRSLIERDAEGRARFVVGLLLDVTREAELRKQLRRSARGESVGRLAAGVAHDFNNLLTVIMGSASVLTCDLGEQEDLNAILEAAERGGALTSRLMTFVRDQVLRPGVFDLDALLERVSGWLRRLIGEDVELRIETGGAGSVRIDVVRFEQVLLNLAANARDAMPDGGRLTFRTSLSAGAEGGLATLEVEDTGTGMSAEVLKSLFQPFFTTKEVGRGRGSGSQAARRCCESSEAC